MSGDRTRRPAHRALPRASYESGGRISARWGATYAQASSDGAATPLGARIGGPLDWIKEKLSPPKPAAPAAAKKRDPGAFDAIIRKYATRKDVLPHYVKGMIHVESAFDPKAVGPSKEIGLMQFLPSTAKSLGYAPEALEDPDTAVQAGTRYLAQIIDGTLAPNLKAAIHPVLKIKLAQFGYTAGPTFLKEILKRYGANAAILSSPANFDLMVESLRDLPLTEKFEKLVPNFLGSRKQVVGRYQYWADRYAPDFGYAPAPAAPMKTASAVGGLGIGAAALAAAGLAIWRLRK